MGGRKCLKNHLWERPRGERCAPGQARRRHGCSRTRLETHTKALDLEDEDEDAKQEYEAYVKLVEQHRRIATELHSLSEQMASYRRLPMGRHDLEALSAPETVDVFERLVKL